LKKEVRCAICKKTTTVEIDNKTKKIRSKWSYWGRIKLADDMYIEYWECPECKEK
jgi:hypothetical protein